MNGGFTKPPCPVCGDPNQFPLWIDAAPPPTCPHDPAWPKRSVVGICAYQRRKAEQAADFRRITPDAFDENGNMLPEQLGRAIEAWADANPGKALML